MPTYGELDNESWWNTEYEPEPLAKFNARCRAHWGLTKSQCGSKGDNLHLRGRHRSRNWVINSRYCTDRSYAATDGRDRRGPGDALRATDIGLFGPPLWEMCRRLDGAVRAGRLPQVAEWFGTFDGQTVVGWSNGRPSTSGRSHLTHGHLGYWTEATTDEVFFEDLFAVLIGDEMLVGDQAQQLDNADKAIWFGGTSMGDPVADDVRVSGPDAYGNSVVDQLAELRAGQRRTEAKVDALQLGGVDPEALAAAMVPHMAAAAEAAVRKVLGAVDGATPAAV